MSVATNTPALPGAKTDSNPAPTAKTVNATEFNNLKIALQDLRNWIQGVAQSDAGAANFLSFAKNTSPPAGVSTKGQLWTDGANLLTNLNGDATNRRVQPFRFNVLDYGADPTGSADSTAAINACCAAAAAVQQSITGVSNTINSYTSPEVVFPMGIYKVSNALSIVPRMRGDQAIINATDPTKNVFTGFTTNVWDIQGFIFRGGLNAIWVSNGGVSNLTINVKNCEFTGQANASFGSDTNAQNAVLNVRDILFYNFGVSGSNGWLFDLQTILNLNCKDGQGAPSQNGFARIGSGKYTFKDFDCAPSGAFGATAPWILISSGGQTILRVDNFRFGGESPATIIRNQCSGSDITVVNSQLYPAVSGGHTIELYAMPIHLLMKGNQGIGYGVYVDSSISSSDLRTLGNTAWIDIEGLTDGGSFASGQPFGADLTNASNLAAGIQRLISHADDAREGAPASTDMVLKVVAHNSQYGYATTATHTTGTTGTNEHGAATLISTQDGSGNIGNIQQNWTTALTSMANGTYTAIFDVTCTQNVLATFFTADQAKLRILETGRHIVPVSFTIDAATSNLYLGERADWLQNSGAVTFGPIRLFKGRVKMRESRTIVSGSASPTTGYWDVDDQIIGGATAGGSVGLICTTAGAGYAATWATSQTVVAGAQWLDSTSGNVYVCRVGGTTNNSGNGPSGTGTNIADGSTVKWDYVSGPATFKTFGSVHA